MTKTLLAMWLALTPGLSLAAEDWSAPESELGIDEKLGQTIALDLTLLDEKGQKVVLKDLIDKPTVLTLVYFRCAGICSPLLNGVVDVLNKSDQQPGKDYQIITVSFDDRDGPEIAAAKKANYLKQLKLTFPDGGWRFLTGDAATTRRLADSVGFRYRKQGEDFIHPAAIFVLSPKGKIARYMYGIRYLPFDLKMALVEASEGRTGPTINKILKFCYSYDPSGQRYFLNVTRVAGVFTLLLLAGFVISLKLRGKTRQDKRESA
ncbi:MAG: SCO family protein [Myxococcaceae bacterium]